MGRLPDRYFVWIRAHSNLLDFATTLAAAFLLFFYVPTPPAKAPAFFVVASAPCRQGVDEGLVALKGAARGG
jgi:hypothetical protein